MAPLISELGKSLENWQALYIIAIAIAFVAAGVIVVFTFYRTHPRILRTSNQIYLASSLLAVISTIVIISKTKSLDAEKDRQTSENNRHTDERISNTERDAAVARADSSRNEVRVQELKTKIAQLESNAAPRMLHQSQVDIAMKALKDFKGSTVWIWPVPNSETNQYTRQLATLLLQSGLSVKYGAVLASSETGLHIVLDSRDNPPALAKVLIEVFQKAGIPFVINDSSSSSISTKEGGFALLVGSKPTALD